MKKILVVATNHGTLGDTNEANGTYAPELTHALEKFFAAGFGFDIASIKGGVAPIYGEDTEGDAINSMILSRDDVKKKLANTLVVEQLNLADYAAIFYPGGFGLLSDLATHKKTAGLLADYYENGGVIGAVCHGPAGLLPVQLGNGESLLSKHMVTGFTREEEVEFGTIEKIPFLLEESLTRSARKYIKRAPWTENVVVDGRLITGQNPASASGVGEAIVNQLLN
ncbi:type 1 glutamine amidotransferase domain-containing protein [Thalassotalea mangrovi]|uniref:Type 1 glutamine amidotransferase domain-containing protein n=1 Tax=Thalassotalea mangrovi TaxID=2572245 RepID=A0A4U1B7Y9_9GAMM|nr:type 1 glutamine amidotransferase domain-containing protein [Thalassotalea mangrovi]TKB46753.1 type 1 glutamine amidotransferase domain-containing protein [Thalassotalea mangrovi]